MAAYFIAAVAIIALVTACLAVPTLILLWAWNVVAPIMGLPEMGWYHALGLVLIFGVVGAAFK